MNETGMSIGEKPFLKNLRPESFEQYAEIVERFKKVPGVEFGIMVKDGDNLTLRLTNNESGQRLRVWDFILKAWISMDVPGSPTDTYFYDILDLEDPTLMVEGGVIKAEKYFRD